jgi:hypothetical protein
MARQFSMPAQIPPVSLLKPAADSAGRTSAYRSLKNALKAYIVVHINQGNAATILLSLLQATDVSGAGSKAISATPIFLCADSATTDALVAQTAAATFTTSAATKDKVVVFELTPEQCMDVANGFDCIAISTGASDVANITEAMLHVLGSYQQATPPSTLTN